MNYLINDPLFRIEILAKTERPNLVSYLAMHQCYSEKVIIDEIPELSKLPDFELGRRVVDKCLKFGHWSVIEAPTITFCVSGFPHNVMVQATRHRHLSFSVQSQRYTGERIFKLAKLLVTCDKEKCTEDADYKTYLEERIKTCFYFRPVGKYLDRNGNKYEYSERDLKTDISHVWESLKHYYHIVSNVGFAPEHSRDFLPQNIRQDFVVTMNARSLLHFCDLRLPHDAQPEIRTMAEIIFDKFESWMPECATWYRQHRYAKNKLSP